MQSVVLNDERKVTLSIELDCSTQATNTFLLS